MAAWYDLGYFPDDLEIAFSENSMFLPLKSYRRTGTGALVGGQGQGPAQQQQSLTSLPMQQ